MPIWGGFLYVAVVIDCFSRRVVGWSMRDHLRTELVLEALEMAIANRRPTSGLIRQSEPGQYTSYVFGRRCREAGIAPSMGSVGDAYENAAAESFFATLECELIDRSVSRNRTEARMALFDFIEAFYNPRRRHSSLGSARRPSSKGSIVRPRSPSNRLDRPAPPSGPGSENGPTALLGPRLAGG